jgi:penicillin-binding protein 2
MPRPPHDFDWSEIAARHDAKPPANTRHRLRWILAFYALALAIVLLRAVQLELSDGEAFRSWAARPAEKIVALAAPRGRILARDGTVLAADRPARALWVHYRYLETPPDPRWLRRLSRARLSRAQRRDPAALAAADQKVRNEMADLHHRLAVLCKLGDAEWRNCTRRIQLRVTKLAEEVNRRRVKRYGEQTSTASGDSPLGVTAILAGLFAPPEPLPPAEVIVVEETAYHRVVDDLPPEAAKTIQHHPDAFPGVTIVPYTRRGYPQGTLAANVVGHVGPRADAETTMVAGKTRQTTVAAAGQMGLERSGESILSGTPGQAREFADRRGKLLSTEIERPGVPGRDIVLTLDSQLQRFAEGLLDRFARRSGDRSAGVPPASHGGAIVVMDVHSGEILAAASEPRFDPNWFAGGEPRVAAVLADPRQPLFDRATKMAIPPGSVFKPLVALALLEHGVVDAEKTFTCQGYLHDPDHLRCQVFRSQGIGHGDVTLAGALARSCNVYFFHHATALGAAPLVDWARRFGFAAIAAVDWPDQAAGHLPDVAELDQQSQLAMFAIGQGSLTATPLEVVRMYAAIANGGYLVGARFTRDGADRDPPSHDQPDSEPAARARIAGLDAASLAAVREGLRQVVLDPAGTAFEAMRAVEVPIAGKTGTAETGGRQADHAWFAGYVPADHPRWAFVVALEHGGSGASAAAIAAGLVQHMVHLGYLPQAVTAEKEFPPGKG